MQFPKVTSVKAIEKYKLWVKFNDNTEGVYDAVHLADKGVFKIWDSHDNFSKVFVSKESGAISWPGELDLDTINIYCTINRLDTDEFLTSKTSYTAHQ